MVDVPLFLVAGCCGAEANLLAMASFNNFLRPDPIPPLPSTPPAAPHLNGEEVHAMRGCRARSAPSSLLPLPNNPIDSAPDNLTIQFFPLPCWWPNTRINRFGDWFAGSWTSPAMEELREAAGQTPLSWNRDFSPPDQGVVHCREVTVMERSNSQTWGFFDPLHSEVSNMVSCSFPPFPVGSSKDLGALRVQSLLVSRKSGGMNSDGCRVTSELHVRCMFAVVTCSWKNCDLNHVMSEAYFPMVLGSFFLEILDVQRWTLKLGSRGVMCIDSRCFFCMLETRMIDDLAEDGGSCSFGSIHQWLVRAPLLLIPRFDEPSLRLASTKEAFEDINCGCASELSLLTHHQTPVAVFPVFGLLSVVLILGLCKDALMYSLFTRAL